METPLTPGLLPSLRKSRSLSLFVLFPEERCFVWG